MPRLVIPLLLGLIFSTLGSPLPTTVDAATPTAAEALKLKPVQGQVPFDNPSADEAEQCSIKAEKVAGATAWVVRGPGGAILRQFADSNNDNVVDTWSYFQNGLETYRDIDGNFNGKADQYRWFQTAGSRWGIDENEDGKIDSWRAISPEETAEEVVGALRTGDKNRFARLLLSDKQRSELGFSKELAESLEQRLRKAPRGFSQLATSKKLSKEVQFSDFGGIRPGMVPQGTQGAKRDVLVYENAWAMVQDGKDHHQLQLGTMVRVGDAWKLVDSPQLGGDEVAGRFFLSDDPSVAAAGLPSPSAPNAEMQNLLTAIEKLDEQISRAAAKDRPKLNARRADMLEKIAAAAPAGAERRQWIEQLADMVSAAVQDGGYPDGVKRLAKLEGVLAKQKAPGDLVTHVLFRRMQAENSLRLASPKADYAKIQTDWLKQLKAFVDKHGTSRHAAEALLQLAMNSEFSRDEKAAEGWYRQIAEKFPKSPSAPKAKGAVTRLTSEGKKLSLTGNSIKGGKIDVRKLRGTPVVVQYWISEYPECKTEHAVLKELYQKYGGKAFEVVGVNLDYTRQQLLDYLKENPLPWQQIYEPGGFDSRPANEMGVVILPLMLLIDAEGVVVSRGISAQELEDELKKLIKTGVGSAQAAKPRAKR